MPDSVTPAIRRVLEYFALFGYPPTLDEVHRFLSVPFSIESLAVKIRKFTASQAFETSEGIEERFVLPSNELFFERYPSRRKTALAKLKGVNFYLSLLQRFPVIEFIGVSGSLAMLNGRGKDDIDLCIVTREGGLWTGRLTAVLLALLLGKKRKRRVKYASDKVCLNLFFSRADLVIPKHKRNEYIAHELLQLRTMYDKGGVYDELLTRNSWVYDLFPNARRPQDSPAMLHRASGELIEPLARAIQLPLVKRHTTKEYITETQLWFFPRDYERTIREKITLRETK